MVSGALAKALEARKKDKGDLVYVPDDGTDKRPIDDECMAQRMLDKVLKDENRRIEEDAHMKKKKREQYGIGWNAESLPRNVGLARKLKCDPVPQGMCCLVLNDELNKVSVVPTIEPLASVNLAYLSLALQVRMREGREPWFTLDPLERKQKIFDSKLPEVWMQEKRFVPEWLAGTSVGEVMFQADYYLKELSMGEYEQPVVGMKSSFDFASGEWLQANWHAREWFVVRKASIEMSEDDVLMPNLKMGVEARELDDEGNDKKVTRDDHPMNQYAQEFSKNFDLIAERKSVIFNLRELAKATVLAKYLIDSKVDLDDSWFNLADEEMAKCCMEIPQLWNERTTLQIDFKDGKIEASEGSGSVHGIYGGVQFGIDKMTVAKPTRVTAARMAARPHLPTGVGGPAAAMAARALPPAAATSAAKVVAPPPAAAVAATRARLPPSRPQGVDLDLGRFDLIDVTRSNKKASISNASLVIGKAFWKSISGNSKLLPDEEKHLMQAIFNPAMSDRRAEGDRFIPPVTSASYIAGLRESVKKEEELRQKRVGHFLSPQFDRDNVGPLFPGSWNPLIKLAQKKTCDSPSALRPCLENNQDVELLQRLKSSSPVFDKATEDGLRFRVYVVDSLEVRTMSESDEKETIGAVFSKQ